MTTETTTKSWFSRLGDSFKGIVIGLVLVVASISLLFWNEGNTLHRKQDLKWAEANCVTVETSPVDPKNNSKPVYLTGEMKTEEILTDPDFPAVSVNALNLCRKVEMYQWQEKTEGDSEKKIGGSEETQTSYTYFKDWFEEPIDSSSFHDAGYDNPGMNLKSYDDKYAQTAAIGDFGAAELIKLKQDKQQFIVKAPEKTTEAAPTETTPVETAPTEAAPAEATPVEATPVEATPTETTPVEAAPTETAPVEAAPTETTPVEATPTETAPVEAAPTETAPVEAAPTEAAPTEAAPAEAVPAEEAASTESSSTAGTEDAKTTETKTETPATTEDAKTTETKTEETTETAAEVKDPNLPKGYSYFNNGYYRGKNPAQPEIGDMRITFEFVPNGTVSVVAGQHENKLIPWQSKNGTVTLLETGTVSKDHMFKAAHDANKMMAWIVRAIGVFLMFIGFNMVFKPLSVLADVIPFIGNLVGGATGIVSFILALSISCLTIGIAWVYYRPWIGIPLLIIAIVLFFWSFKFGKKKPEKKEE